MKPFVSIMVLNQFWLASSLYLNILPICEVGFEIQKDDFEEFKKFVIYQTNQVPRIVGRVIDSLEKEISQKFPQVEHIDLEIN